MENKIILAIACSRNDISDDELHQISCKFRDCNYIVFSQSYTKSKKELTGKDIAMLNLIQTQKISTCDILLVVTKNYRIGCSTSEEIKLAYTLNKDILYKEFSEL